HTEMLANLAGVPVAMMLASDRLRVVLATTHIPLAEVPARLTREHIVDAARITKRGLQDWYGIAGPFPADTVFVRALRGEFDAVIAPYHDVGMTAIKVASFGRAVNVTLGLP